MHFHICPTEIAAFFMLVEAVQMYAYHYWLTIKNVVTGAVKCLV